VQKLQPVQVSGFSGAAAAVGHGYMVALKRDGTLWSWGYNGYGQLGDGTFANRSLPGAVSGLY
jgi:alpha-tubulin suppressor-like RCC1 family protein